MKTLLYLGIVCGLLIAPSQALNAQNYSRNQKRFEAGHLELKIGMGMISSFTTKYIYTKVPPISLQASFRLKKHASLGLYLAKTSNVFVSDLPISPVIPRYFKSDLFLVGIRASGHYNLEDLDFYGGAMLAYIDSHILTDVDRRRLKENIKTEDMAKRDFIYSGHMGVQYLINKHFGIYSEFGFGLALFKIGMLYKM